MTYGMILLDMDGTALRDDKSISPALAEAVEEASAAGKRVLFASGRAVEELYPYNGQVPGVRHVICESGAILWDRENDRILQRETMTADETAFILRQLRESGMEYMMQAFSEGRNMIARKDLARIEEFHMEAYLDQYIAHATILEDVDAAIEADPGNFEKLSPIVRTAEERDRLIGLLSRDSLEVVPAELSQAEACPKGVNKGSAMRKACELFGIPLSETVAVGNEENDLSMLEAAGLAVAVGNAAGWIRERCDAVVADNNHDGAAEAIRRFLLS